MRQDKSLVMVMAEWWEIRRHRASSAQPKIVYWLPTPGNVIFTLLVLGSLFWAQSVGAISLGAPLDVSTSTGTLAYQGRLANSSGEPLTQTVNMTFRLYAAVSGGTPLWEEQWTGANSVQVSDGLFNVMLGSLTSIPPTTIAENSNIFLGITVGTDSEMSPRVQLGSVPFATQALTVPDGSITKAKLASDVELVPADGSITTQKLSSGAATGIWYARGVSDATTNSVSYVLMPDMQLAIETIGEPVEIRFDTGFKYSGDYNAGSVDFGIFIDGSEKTRHAYRIPTNGHSIGASVMWVENLAPGSHTIEVKWRVTTSTITATSQHETNPWERRVLVVTEYRR
ncbi:MAG: hypothetical protein R3C14_39840 [Caldilineaceae bacterium]